MTAGLLDQRVKLLRRDLSPSAFGTGEQTEEFTLVATVWARVSPLRSAEGFSSMERFATATHAFRIRWRADVRPSFRLEWRGERYDILEILPAGQRHREWLDLVAQASAAENPGS